jgi:hypothetical protein
VPQDRDAQLKRARAIRSWNLLIFLAWKNLRGAPTKSGQKDDSERSSAAKNELRNGTSIWQLLVERR